MRYLSVRQIAGVCLLAAALAVPSALQGSDTIHSGWDLLFTEPGTTFAGVGWQGVGLGNFDFGGSTGVQWVGGVDTIVHRTTDAHGPSDTVPLTLAALQLETVDPISFGGGPFGDYFLTLQSVRGGTASGGTMNITFGPEGEPHGTFNSTLDVFFDIRFGSLSGPIVFSSDVLLTAADVPWGHTAPIDALLIAGVDYLLDGVDTYQDFFPGGLTLEGGAQPFAHINNDDPLKPHHVVITPEPTTSMLAILAIGLSGLNQYRRKIS
jgi:hypothetical protein